MVNKPSDLPWGLKKDALGYELLFGKEHILLY